MKRILLSLSLLILPLAGRGFAQEQEPVFPWVELPDSPVAKAFAAVGESTAPAQFGADFPLEKFSTGSAWELGETWLKWSEWLVGDKELIGREEAASRRAGLAWLALEHGRNEDAWAHFAACADSPKWMALLMPRFLPGTPALHRPQAAGRPGLLPNGVLLEPCIPSVPASLSGMLLAREATIRDLHVGDARFDMKVTFDSYGVQIDFEWKSGGPARMLVLIPEPDGYTIRVEYVDWMRQDEKRIPHLVELSEEAPQISLFARILSSQSRWPAFGSQEIPSELAQAGLWLEHEANESESEYLRAVAQAATHVLGLKVGLREHISKPRTTADKTPRGIILRVPPPGPERARKLAWLASTLERYVLARAEAGK